MSNLLRARTRIKSWRENPAQFVHENFGVEPDAWQKDALERIGGLCNPSRRLCLKACTGPGKSAVLSWAGWHRLACFGAKGEHPKGAALSITRENLRDNLWAELAKWQSRSAFLSEAFTWTKERIYANDHAETWFLSARSFARDADADTIGRTLSGLHSKYPFILLDETGDMPVQVVKAAEQIFTGMPIDALILQAGNPTSTTGLLYHCCVQLKASWQVIPITADPDDPKRTPRVDIELAREQIRQHGRDNPWVMATILGLFPPAGFRSLLGVEEVEAAMGRHHAKDKYQGAAKIIGLDVARDGDDRSVMFPRQGIVAFRPKVYRGADSQFLAGAMLESRRKWNSDGEIIDGTGGWGSGVIDAMRAAGGSPFDCQFAGEPFDKKYANKRAEIWFEMAKWVKSGGALPNIPEMVAELTTPTYTFQGDRFLLEPKDQIKKRLGRSPDYADALAVTFAFPIQPKAPAIIARPNFDFDPLAALNDDRGDTIYEHNPFNLDERG